jgi:hypothetical protein
MTATRSRSRQSIRATMSSVTLSPKRRSSCASGSDTPRPRASNQICRQKPVSRSTNRTRRGSSSSASTGTFIPPSINASTGPVPNTRYAILPFAVAAYRVSVASFTKTHHPIRPTLQPRRDKAWRHRSLCCRGRTVTEVSNAPPPSPCDEDSRIMPVSARYVHPHHCPPRSTSCSGGTVGSRDTSRRGNQAIVTPSARHTSRWSRPRAWCSDDHHVNFVLVV